MNRLAAKKHWQAKVEAWTAWAALLSNDIIAIESPVLRHTVAGIVDVIASGYGKVALQRNVARSTFSVVGFAVDTDVHAALTTGIHTFDPTADSEAVLSEAREWLATRCKGATALDVAWALGALQDITPIEMNQKWPRRFVMDEIVYDIVDGSFIGVRYDGGILKCH